MPKNDWHLKEMGNNGDWWLRRAGDVLLSVAAKEDWHRHHPGFWWRVKVGSNTLFEGEAPSVASAKEAAEAKAREFVKAVLAEL